MKKMACVLLVAAMFAACGTKSESQESNGVEYTVRGAMNTSHDNTYVYISEMGGENIDSALILNGQFELSGTFPQTTIYRVKYGRSFINLVTGDEPLDLIWDNKFALANHTGASAEISEIDSVVASYREGFNTYYMANQKASREELMAEYEKINQKITDFYVQIIAEKVNEVKPLYAALLSVNSIERISQLDSLIAEVPLVENSPIVNMKRQHILQLEKVSAGAMFVDFDGTDLNGKVAKLSDYVGKGNYVLVDFWASWCGPCRGEIPNLRNVYEKHKSNGLILLGVNVWDDKEKFHSSVEHEEMTWNHIYASHDRNATDTYAIQGIPCIILFAPDGTIVNRTIRGEEIMKLVDSVYTK